MTVLCLEEAHSIIGKRSRPTHVSEFYMECDSHCVLSLYEMHNKFPVLKFPHQDLYSKEYNSECYINNSVCVRVCVLALLCV